MSIGRGLKYWVLRCMAALKNKVHESFARLLAIGTSGVEAYTSAMLWHGEKPSSSYGVAANYAHRLMKRDDVLARIQEFKYELQLKADEEFAIDIKKAVKILVDTINSRPDQASMDNPLCEIAYVGKNAVPAPIFPSKAKYMEILARMMGWNSETINLKGDVHIEFTVHDRRKEDGTTKLANATTIEV